MKIKFWLYIFVLSFSLMAIAGVPTPVKIPKIRNQLEADVSKVLNSACFPHFEIDAFAISDLRKFQLSSLMPGGLVSCPKLFFLRTRPVDFNFENGSRLKVFESPMNRFLGDLEGPSRLKGFYLRDKLKKRHQHMPDFSSS